MATPRTARQASSSSPSPARTRTMGSSEKKIRHASRTRHRGGSISAYARSIEAVERGIARLKRKLVRKVETPEILDDFFDHVTTEPAFCFELLLGPKWLSDSISRSCETILDKPPGTSTVFLVEAPEHELIYGSVVIGDYTGLVVFFEDIRLGAVGLFHERQSLGAVFMRLVMVNEEDEQSAEPPN